MYPGVPEILADGPAGVARPSRLDPVQSVETHSMRQFFAPRPGGTSDRRWLVFAVSCGLLAWLASGEVARLVAQEPAGKTEAPAAKDAAPPKDEAPAPAGEAASPPANAGAATGTTPPAPESLLSLAIRASGPIGGFLLLLSIYFTALVIRLFMELRVSE